MNTPPPRITVITPCLNDAVLLERTLCSVIDQSYRNLEYLVVDGGSTDGGVFLLQHYDQQITWWLSERDAGRSDAIRKALERSTGELVTILDAGDVLLPGALHAIADSAHRDEASWWTGHAQLMDDRAIAVGRVDHAVNVWRRGLLAALPPISSEKPLRFEQVTSARLLRDGRPPSALGCITAGLRQPGAPLRRAA